MIERENDRADTSEAPVNDEVEADSRRCFVAFFVFLLLFGGILSCFFVKSILQVVGARDWHEVSCVIVNSKVVESSSGDGSGTSYRIEVLYMYEVDGRRYQSSRYEFFDLLAWTAGKQAVVDLYPPGKRTVCYVDPNDPREAVINRGLPAGVWWGFIPALLVVIGIKGILWQVKGQSKIQQNDRSDRNKPTDDQLESFRQASCCFWGCFCMVLLGMLGIFGVSCLAYQLSSGIRSIAHEFVTALDSEDYHLAFEMCSPTLQEQLGNEQHLKELCEDGSEYWEPSLWNSMGGNEKTASLSSRGRKSVTLRFEKVGDQWRVSHFNWSTPLGGGLKLPKRSKDKLRSKMK